MERVAITGCCGSGKSTLAAKMEKALDLPLYSLDDLFWHADWVVTPKDEWRKINEELVAKERWIIEGTFVGTLDLRMARLDTLVLIDLPTWLCLWRITKRNLKDFFGLEQSLPKRIQQAHQHKRQRILSDWGFYNYTRTFKKKFYPAIQKMIKGLRPDQRVILLRSDKEICEFLRELQRTASMQKRMSSTV